MLTRKTEILEKPWQERRYQDHRRKVDSALPAIDSRPPPVYSHLQLRLKRLQLEEERLAKIYKDNRRLLGRMAAIVSTKRIDNENQQHAMNAKLLARGKASGSIGLTFSQRVINSSADSSRRGTPSSQENTALFDLYDSSPPYHLCRKLKMNRRQSPQAGAITDKKPASRSRSRDSALGTNSNNPSSPVPSVTDVRSNGQSMGPQETTAINYKKKLLKRPPMKYTSSMVLRKNPTRCCKAEPPKVIKLDDFCDTSGCVSVTFELSIKDDGHLQIKLVSKETENGLIDAPKSGGSSPAMEDPTENGENQDDDDEIMITTTDASPEAIPTPRYFIDETIRSKVTEQINSSGIELSSGIDPHHSSLTSLNGSTDRASPSFMRPSSALSSKAYEKDGNGPSRKQDEPDDDNLVADLSDVKKELLEIRRESLKALDQKAEIEPDPFFD